MTRLSQRLLVLYLATLLALAALGAHNQLRSSYQENLSKRQQALNLQLTELRRDAAQITGALAVRSWATASGMVAAPEALNISDVQAAPAPQTDAALVVNLNEGVEVETLWR